MQYKWVCFPPVTASGSCYLQLLLGRFNCTCKNRWFKFSLVDNNIILDNCNNRYVSKTVVNNEQGNSIWILI